MATITAEVLTTVWNQMSIRATVSVSQNVGANTSTLTITALEVRSNTYYGNCFVSGTLTIDGKTALYLELSNTVGHSVALATGEWKPVGGVAGTAVTVAHSADGSGGYTLAGDLSATPTSGSGSFWVRFLGSGTFSLPTIPRVSGISVSGGTLGTAATVKITRQSASLTDTVTWQCGSDSGTIAAKTSAASLTWTPPVSLASANPTGDAVTVTFTVTTYAGSTAMGSKSVNAAFTIPASVAPTVSFTVTDVLGHIGKYGGYVEGNSRIRVDATAAGAYGSTVRSVTLRCGDLTASGTGAVFTLPAGTSVTVRAEVTDSRGRSASASGGLTAQSYAPPTVTLTALERCNSDGAPAPGGLWLRAVFTARASPIRGGNTTVYTLRKRVRGTSAWSDTTITAYGGSFSVTGGTALSGADGDKDYQVCVRVSDDFSATQSHILPLPPIFALMDFHRGTKSAGLLHRAVTGGGVDVGGNMVLYGNRIRDMGAPEAATDAVTKGYVDGRFAPAGYGLGSADSKQLSTADDLNNCAENGFYSWAFAPINAPFYNGMMIVATYDWARKVQYIWSAENGCAVQRIQFGASWSEPEWVNPTMAEGVEYRTTERWNGYVVYTRLVNCGIVANGATVNIDGVTACVRFFGYISYLNESALRKQLPIWSGETIGTGYHAEVTQSTGAYNTSQFIIKTDSAVDSYGNGGYIWFVQAWYTKD